MVTGSIQSHVRSVTKACITGYRENRKNTLRNTLNHPFWTPENKSNVYPKPWNVGGELYALQNYGFVRLQDLNISYSLPQRWLKVVGIKNLQVFVSGQNLFFIAPGWEYSDPEVRSFQSQQLRRTYTFGLNLRF